MRRHRTSNRAFSLIEMLIVVLILGILLAVAVPNWMSARERSRQGACFQSLNQIESGKEQFAIENRLGQGDVVNETDIWPAYIRGDEFPSCPAGGVYNVGVVGTWATCTYHGSP